ncbi:MAG: hypothetical protein LBQ78_04470 [Tannerellaceae bacterium]|nr:hypothetical protein [Tannerellaceae bacterium]
MKRLVAFVAVVAAITFTSCGNKTSESTGSVAENETETVVVEETASEAVDGSEAADSTETVETPAETVETPAE